MLGATFRNVQVSWVKEGLAMSERLLACGANDLGGTLINESISTSAGARHGQLASPRELRRVIRAAGRVPAERTSLYAIRRVFANEADEPPSPLDDVADADARFGSYAGLARGAEFRFRDPSDERSPS
jgi:FO synthase subunit 2